MKNIAFKSTLLLFFLAFGLCLSNVAEAAVSPTNAEAPREQVQKASKKEIRQQIRAFRQTHKSEMEGMSKKERRNFVLDGIDSEQFVPGAWFPIGITLVIIGAIMGLIFTGPISLFGLAIGIVGLGFLVVWIIKEINRSW